MIKSATYIKILVLITGLGLIVAEYLQLDGNPRQSVFAALGFFILAALSLSCVFSQINDFPKNRTLRVTAFLFLTISFSFLALAYFSS